MRFITINFSEFCHPFESGVRFCVVFSGLPWTSFFLGGMKSHRQDTRFRLATEFLQNKIYAMMDVRQFIQMPHVAHDGSLR